MKPLADRITTSVYFFIDISCVVVVDVKVKKMVAIGTLRCPEKHAILVFVNIDFSRTKMYIFEPRCKWCPDKAKIFLVKCF